MNESLIALSSIFVGVISVLIYTLIAKKQYFNYSGNIIISVFGSVFFNKLFGRLGVNPALIYANETYNTKLLILYFFISIIGSLFLLILIKKITTSKLK